ncbi:Imm1 family immunity protein [Polymorphospora lycopeni]|uniref:Imm1 family immunity protein n=1 Tax=Polymorphospora lycopeni TaxID=3140240 RepID=A0ABV5CNP5_9ACTN
MTIQISWGRGAGSATVDSVTGLDTVLDSITPTGGLPYCVSLIVPDGSDFPPMLQICVGHPERSFAYHVAADGSSGWAHQPELDNGPAFTFDYAGTPTDAWPERTRVTPAGARAAAREFLASGGGRPSNLAWDVVAD